MEFFTSDHHFFHKNILKFEERPYDNVDEMNEQLVRIWNDTVSKSDTVYHIGDISFGGTEETTELLSRLNGSIIVCKGNHDGHNRLKKYKEARVIKDFHLVGTYIKRHKYQLWLTHFPMEIGNRPRYFNIHGHIHAHPSTHINQINVGVDSPLFEGMINFGEPVPLDLIVDYMDFATPVVEVKKKIEYERRI